MRPRLSGLVKRLLAAGGHYRRKLAGARFPGVAVLCYHGVRRDESEAMPFAPLHVTATELAAHCRLIAATCQPIGPADWLAGKPLPPRPVLMTFDDGYRSFLDLALPALAARSVPATLFVTSGAVAEGRLFWFDAVARAQGEGAVERLKDVPYPTWRQTVERLERQRPAENDPCAPLSPEELSRLAGEPSVTVGGHTVNHPILARAGLRQQQDEIALDRKRLAEWLGRAPSGFAYPNGRPGIDYTADTVELVAAAGYRTAYSTRAGFSRPGGRALERNRFMMLAGIGGAELAHRLAYSWRRPT